MKAAKVKEWILNNILTIIEILPGLIGICYTTIGDVAETLTEREFYLLLVLLIILVLVAIRAVWNVISYKSYYYPWLKIRTIYNYTVLEKKITYRRDSKDALHYSRTMKIKCCSNLVEYAYDKYIWTGIQPNDVKIIPVNGIAGIKDKSRIGIWHYFEMELNNHMRKGDEREISYKWPNIESCTKSSPFFSTSTDEPTKKIILSLELGEEYANQEIICEEFRAVESDYPMCIEKRKLDERGNYTWEIPWYKVKMFRHYRIRWSWCKGQPATKIDKE